MKTKKLKKLSSIFLVLILIVSSFNFAITASASTTYYAYSIGVNHGTTNSGLSGDFTSNVKYANTWYGMISGIASYYNCSPTSTYMKGTNPVGTRRIASRIVFLNGHGSASNIVFNHNNEGGYYDTGVTIGKDTTKCVGLQSTDMSTVDLISFVGCNTANGTTNIAITAHQRGAKSSVGFTNSISSRTTDGRGWCRKYNDALTLGYTISGAISYATSCYPNSNLGTYVKVYGSTSNKVANSSGSVASLSVETPAPEITQISVDVYNSNAKTNNSLDIEEIINEIKKIDSSFDISDYTVKSNMFSEDKKSGIIIFTYMINEEIRTNFAYVVEVKDGIATNIYCGNKKDTADINVSSIENAVSTSKMAASEPTTHTFAKGINTAENSEEYYYYDFNTNVIRHIETFYYCAENAENVIVDVVNEETINS